MLCYRDRTFCTYYTTCRDAKRCPRPLRPDVIDAAQTWWGALGIDGTAPIMVFADTPHCHRPTKEPSMQFRPNIDVLPFTSTADDWCAFVGADDVEEAVIFIESGEGVRPVWIHTSIQRTAANSANIDEGYAFVVIGGGVTRWLNGNAQYAAPQTNAVHSVGFRGWPERAHVLVLEDAVYVWDPRFVTEQHQHEA